MRTKLFFLVLLIFTACKVPQDPEHSFLEAQKDKLLVGVVDNPPFASTAGETISGSEIEQLRNFATQENLQIEFIKGNESELIEKLEKFKIHVVTGGFTKKTIWKKKAGLTTTYDKKHVFLIPKGENLLLEHLEDYIYQNKK